MTSTSNIDGVLVLWGDRLFYPGNRITRSSTPKLSAEAIRQRAQEIRARIEATVVRRAPQVMVKVTGGGRGMGAIAAHLRYISKGGRLPIEDDRGVAREGPEALQDIVTQWRMGGTRIPDRSERREAFNVMLSMPTGTKTEYLQQAVREFAAAELAGLGFDVLPSQANFIFAAHPRHDAAALAQALRERAILVRHFSRPARIADRLRITIGTPAQCDALVAALREILGQQG